MTQYQFPENKPCEWTSTCKIIGMASYLPSTRISNEQISIHQKNPLPAQMIQKMIGVQTRHVAPPDFADSDLLLIAAQNCLIKTGISIEQVSKLIVNKFLGDRLLPPTAAILQGKLGCTKTIQCMDIDGGTNSFMQAFLMAAKCIQSGDEYVLIVSGGICNNLISKKDPRVAYLFGDGATAVLLGKSDSPHILSYYEFSNYAYSELFRAVEFYAFAKVDPLAMTTDEALHDAYKMGNWKDAQDFILQASQHTINCLLESAKCSFEQIDWFIITENNRPLWESIVKQLNIPANKTLSLLQHQGNTLSANLPMLLNALDKKQSLQPGRKLLMLSIGEGICGGGCIYQV